MRVFLTVITTIFVIVVFGVFLVLWNYLLFNIKWHLEEKSEKKANHSNDKEEGVEYVRGHA